MSGDSFETIQVGDEARLSHVISESDLDAFAKLTGDTNPLHMDEAFAGQTEFKNRVVHGMLTASFISTIIGTKLPGKGALWFEQRLGFLSPVRVGEEIKVWAKVTHKSPAQRILVLQTDVFGGDGRKVIEGEAKVKVLEIKKKRTDEVTDVQKGSIIVTGSTRGIGAAIAKALAAAGFPVVVNYSRKSEAADSVVRDIVGGQGRAAAFQADVSDSEAVKKMARFARDQFGPIAGAVNNAAPPIGGGEFAQLAWGDVQRHIDVQLKGAFNVCQAILPDLLENGRGSIVNIASTVVDNVPPIKWLPYTLAKTALVSFSRSLAAEYGPKGIRVNCVSPGMTDTELIADVPEKNKMLMKMQTPTRRLTLPEDVAATVAFLLGDGAQQITGQNIRVCGGLVMA